MYAMDRLAKDRERLMFFSLEASQENESCNTG